MLKFLILLSFLSPLSAWASAEKCLDLFAYVKNENPLTSKIATEIKRIPIEQVIDQKKMAEQGFEVQGTKLYDLRNKKVIGDLMAERVPNLYQWGPINDQRAQVHNGGILKSEMDYILSQGPQTYGRGFYVSKNPFDSSNGYGNGLSVFTPSGPMLYVNFNDGIMSLDTKSYQRLSAAGIDAIQINHGGSNSWLSVISTKHLKIATPESITDSFWSKKGSFDDIISIDSKLSLSKFWDLLPKNNIYRKLVEGDFQGNQIWDFVKQNDAAFLQAISTSSSRGPIYKKLVEAALQIDFVRASQKEILRALQITQLVANKKLPKAAETKFTQLLKYVDLFTLAKIIDGERLKEAKSIEEVLDFAETSRAGEQQIELNKIKSADSFLQELSKLLPEDPEVRSFDVIMSSEHATNSTQIVTSSEIYDQLRGNLFLTVGKSTLAHEGNYYELKYKVTYASFEKLLGMLDRLPLRRDLKSYLQKNQEALLKNPESKAAQSAYKELMKNLLEAFFDPIKRRKLFWAMRFDSSVEYNSTREISALEIYTTFMSLHPLADANGRAGRLMYKYLTYVMEGKAKDLLLPSFDLDLFLHPANLPEQSNLVQAFLIGISKIDNLEDFKTAVMNFIKAYQVLYPNLYKSIFNN